MARSELDYRRNELLLPDWTALEAFLRNHPHEAAEVKFLQSIVAKGNNAIAVGAGTGITTMAISRSAGDNGTVYAFEPHPVYFTSLKENLASNQLNNVEVFDIALTDHTGTVDFYLREFSSGIVFSEGVEKRELACTTIDSFLDEQHVQRIDIVDMDCEGSEMMVLKGAEKTLRTNKIKVFCEIHHDFLDRLGQSVIDIVEYLHDLGFEVHSVYPNELRLGDEFDSPEYIYGQN